MKQIPKFSFGVGDRFAQEGVNQLSALLKASELYGREFAPVWNKSNREHTIIGTTPKSTRQEADEAVAKVGYKGEYFCDADHISMKNVDMFIEHCDFFTLDVADYIRKASTPEEKYSLAIAKAGELYRYIAAAKGEGNFVTEVSMDEVDEAQTPEDIRYILTEIAKEKIPVQTFAPKFTGRFNKGVDYVGDVSVFAKEFEEDILVLKWAVEKLGLPENLKLSVHSGSDKFSIYPIIGELIRKHDVGVHIKTAGTTWLEELIGLALSGGKALELAKRIYAGALARKEELSAPYATVIDIDENKLPSVDAVNAWSKDEFARALRHEQSDELYNPSFRQLMHVSFKIAAELGNEFITALRDNAAIIGEQITANISERHIRRL
ncbi:MAG: hypothetical protein J6S51_01035 [Kiritimatiellae bacterium]|nr:hypothetical protein [Kiritimatiellia bacterium]